MRYERIDLEKAHPLPFPLAIWVEPTNICNFKCSFCPESLPNYAEQAGYYQHMPMELWAKIARDIRELGRPKVIRFFHEGEPLLNRNLPSMIQAAQGALTDRTEAFTNGSLLDRFILPLVESGLAYLKVSVYGVTESDFQTATGSFWTPRRIIENVRMLHNCRAARPIIHAKLMMPDPTPEQVALFHSQYDSIADQADVMGPAHNWAGSLAQIGDTTKMRRVCPMPFYTMSVKANGKVTVCCADWKNELAIGDVTRQSLKEIWEGEALRQIQQIHWEGRREELSTCRNCTAFAEYPDNLDGHLELIGQTSL